MNEKNEVYVEKRVDQGDFAVRLPDSERASGTAATQVQAIKLAKKMHPKAAVMVERVRKVGDGPDKWRRA